MKPETQHRIDKALNALDSVKQAEVSADFTQNVLQRLQQGKPLRVVPMRTVWTVAAAIAFLLALNVWVGIGYKGPSQNQRANNAVQQLVSEYGIGVQGFSY